MIPETARGQGWQANPWLQGPAPGYEECRLPLILSTRKAASNDVWYTLSFCQELKKRTRGSSEHPIPKAALPNHSTTIEGVRTQQGAPRGTGVVMCFFFVLSETFDKCSRLFGTSDTWSETEHYRPLVPTQHPHREGALELRCACRNGREAGY
jgi:hypothetical protein